MINSHTLHIFNLQDRKSGLTDVQKAFAKDFEHMTDLVEITKKIKPTIALGKYMYRHMHKILNYFRYIHYYVHECKDRLVTRTH